MPGKKGRSGRPKCATVRPPEKLQKDNKPKSKGGRPKKTQPTSQNPDPNERADKPPEPSTSHRSSSQTSCSEKPTVSVSSTLKRPRRSIHNPIAKEWDAVVGPSKSVISNYRLPTRRVILQRYRHLSEDCIGNQWKSEANKQHAISKITSEVVGIWNKARVIMVARKNVFKRIKQVINSYVDGRLYINKKDKIKKRETEEYQQYLNELCDLSPTDVFEKMKSTKKATWQEDYNFLLNQRKVPQVGHMEGTDYILFEQEQRVEQHQMKKQKRLHKELQRKSELYIANSTDEENEEILPSGSESEDEEYTPKLKHSKTISPVKIEVDSKNIMKDSAELATRLKLSTTQHLAMVTKVVKSGKGKIKGNIFSRTTTWRHKKQKQKEIATKIKSTYNPPRYAISHHDTKMISYITGRTDERLALCVSGDDIKKPKFIGAPRVPDGTGQSMCASIKATLDDWGVTENLIGTVWDTTASNSGVHEGAVTHLEETLERKLLWIPCRHHEHELHIKHSNIAIRGPSKGKQTI